MVWFDHFPPPSWVDRANQLTATRPRARRTRSRWTWRSTTLPERNLWWGGVGVVGWRCWYRVREIGIFRKIFFRRDFSENFEKLQRQQTSLDTTASILGRHILTVSLNNRKIPIKYLFRLQTKRSSSNRSNFISFVRNNNEEDQTLTKNQEPCKTYDEIWQLFWVWSAANVGNYIVDFEKCWHMNV